MSHKENRPLIKALTECAAACEHCSIACLGESDVQMMVNCIKLDIDCAQICRLTASFAARGSDHTSHIARKCAEICDACAHECEKYADAMDHCRECAEACRRCSDACRNLQAASVM